MFRTTKCFCQKIKVVILDVLITVAIIIKTKKVLELHCLRLKYIICQLNNFVLHMYLDHNLNILILDIVLPMKQHL